MTLHTFKRQLKAHLLTSDVLANRRNIHHRPVLLWRFRDSGARYKTADLLTYLPWCNRQAIHFPCKKLYNAWAIRTKIFLQIDQELTKL